MASLAAWSNCCLVLIGIVFYILKINKLLQIMCIWWKQIAANWWLLKKCSAQLMTYVALSVDWQRTERSNGSIRWNGDKTVRPRVVKIGWKWKSALRRGWDGVRTAHSHLWAWEGLTSNRRDLCPPPLPTSSIYCCPSQPPGDTGAHITSIAWFKLIHPLNVSRPLSHLGHVGTTECGGATPFVLHCPRSGCTSPCLWNSLGDACCNANFMT